jgi:hypothetical protein
VLFVGCQQLLTYSVLGSNVRFFFVKQQIKDIQGLRHVCLLKHSFHKTGFVSSMLPRDQNVKLKEETKM